MIILSRVRVTFGFVRGFGVRAVYKVTQGWSDFVVCGIVNLFGSFWVKVWFGSGEFEPRLGGHKKGQPDDFYFRLTPYSIVSIT